MYIHTAARVSVCEQAYKRDREGPRAYCLRVTRHGKDVTYGTITRPTATTIRGGRGDTHTRAGRRCRHATTRTRAHTAGLSRARHWYRQQHGARGIESGPIAVCAYGHGDGAVHLTATHHHSALLTLYSLSSDFNNFSVSSLQYLCIGISRMGGPTTGDILYRVERKNRVLRLHAYTECRECL